MTGTMDTLKIAEKKLAHDSHPFISLGNNSPSSFSVSAGAPSFAITLSFSLPQQLHFPVAILSLSVSSSLSKTSHAGSYLSPPATVGRLPSTTLVSTDIFSSMTECPP